MAVSKKDCTLLLYSKSIGVSFENTLMLGRLKLNVSNSHFKYFQKYNIDFDPNLQKLENTSGYSENFFKAIGAIDVQSLDYSNYEGATIVHDMNFPVSQQLHSRFTSIVDGGTIEHIFNFPVAIKNCMEMLQIGGHFIGITPANNQMGHGFYQFSPELFYRVFTKENGFEVKKMLITTTDDGAWYEVADPSSVKSRVMLVNNLPLSLMVIAEKKEVKEIFKAFPQQSDYQTAWGIATALKNDIPLEHENILKLYYRKYFPKSVKRIVRLIYDFFTTKKVESSELGMVNTDHFRKVDI